MPSRKRLLYDAEQILLGGLVVAHSFVFQIDPRYIQALRYQIVDIQSWCVKRGSKRKGSYSHMTVR
jgi:hypothetical protein